MRLKEIFARQLSGERGQVAKTQIIADVTDEVTLAKFRSAKKS